MELWIPIAVFAGFMQNLRSVLQKQLKGRLSDLGSAYVRFLYALPLAALYVWALLVWRGGELPDTNPSFLVYVALGGLCQIVFTWLLLYLFSFRNFAVGTTFSKTEVIQVAILGFLVLGDAITGWATVAVLLAFVGVMVLSLAGGAVTVSALVSGLGERTTLLGLTCGAFLGGSVVFIRGAALALNVADPFMAAAFTLLVCLAFQTVVMGLYLYARERHTLVAVFTQWRTCSWVGITAVLASIGWFTASTLEVAAYVRAVGQVELVFAFVASVLLFGERPSRTEVVGIALIVASILLLVLAGYPG